ncbi:MAG: cation transporter [Candidatus Omnitrophica bacterium]|nr:cation transporter [Candidatus Omnitrophota bacterium]
MANSKAPAHPGYHTLTLVAGIAACLAVLKLGFGFFTNSMAILASGIDSLIDVFVSLANRFLLKRAEAPPDADHRYGHGKIQSLAGLFQGVFFGLTGVWVAGESMRRMITGEHRLHNLNAGVWVMVLSMAVTGWLIFRLRRAFNKKESLIVETEHLHYSTDLFSNAGVLLTLFAVEVTREPYWDLVFSVIIGAYILHQGSAIVRKAVDELVDRALPESSYQEMKDLILNFHPGIVDFHDFRSRQVGGRIFVEFHLEIAGETDFRRAHDLTEDLTDAIKKKFAGAEVTIHADPAGAR